MVYIDRARGVIISGMINLTPRISVRFYWIGPQEGGFIMLRVIIIILAFLIAVFIWLPNSLKSPFVIKNEKIILTILFTILSIVSIYYIT